MKRIFDIFLSFVALIVLGIPMLMVALAVRFTSKGPALHWSNRVGKENKIFKMPKFRTMRVDTPPMATHLMTEPEKFLTPIGGFLRKTSLDELPQFISILLGDMSFVGPRPALFNQDDLISLRTAKGVHRITPGLTGWAQVNGRDDLAIPVKVEYDEFYLKNRSFGFDLKILVMTAVQAVMGKGVKH
jgi:O-antigen biosynthesis protein WbqP